MTCVAAVDGVLEQANGFHEREVGALGLFRDLGDRYKEAEILTHLGDTYQAAGKTETPRRPGWKPSKSSATSGTATPSWCGPGSGPSR